MEMRQRLLVPPNDACPQLPGNWKSKCARCNQFTYERDLKPVWNIAKPAMMLLGFSHEGIPGRFCPKCRRNMNSCVFAIVFLGVMLIYAKMLGS